MSDADVLERLARRLDRLESEQAIRETMVRYAQTLDYGDSAGWAACYTADGVFDVRRRGEPLFKHQGFTNTDIATVTKVFGFWIALGGTFMAGWLIPRIGMMSSLLIGTVAGSASHLALAFLAAHGGDGGKAFWTFALAVGVEGFAYAFASIVLITYMSTLASVEHAASQFGLLTSLCAFPGSILAGFSGFVIEHTGFVWFFIWTSLIGIPVVLLAVFVWYRVGISDEAPIRVEGGH